MKKTVINIALILLLAYILTGCKKEEQPTTTPPPTKTESVSVTPEATPTPIADAISKSADSPSYIDSSKEVFKFLSADEEKLHLELMAMYAKDYDLQVDMQIVLAYYVVIDALEVEVPVVVSMQPDDAEQSFGGEWVSVSKRSSSEEAFEKKYYSYGVMSMEQIKQLVEADSGTEVYVADDSTIGDVYNKHKNHHVAEFRAFGTVSVTLEDEGYLFDISGHDDWIYQIYESDFDEYTHPPIYSPDELDSSTEVFQPLEGDTKVIYDTIYDRLLEGHMEAESMRDRYAAIMSYYLSVNDYERWIPVIANAAPEELAELYGGVWKAVEYDNESLPDGNYSFGVMRVRQIMDYENSESEAKVYIAADETVEFDVTNEQGIDYMRYYGEYSVYESDGVLKFGFSDTQ